jgi:prepilin-type N-terminal cleavage/methylation domain-containing protein
MRGARSLSRGFTLLEMLIVIAIVLLVSALTLPTIVSGLSHRQVSESARILQAALSGARDAAIRNNAPSGIRLLPDPVFNGVNSSTGLLDPTAILAASRIIPLDPAPDYSNGRVFLNMVPQGLHLPYPGDGGGYYPINVQGSGAPIVLEECPFDLNSNAVLPNEPTSWFWNIRVGDQIRINSVGPWFTVVGPLNQAAAQGNSELFVNVGPPGTQSPLARLFFNGVQAIVYYPEFLLLVNGLDDNGNGWVDEGWDGVDNNGNGLVDEIAEWELENPPQTILAGWNSKNAPYVIRRRPAPGPNAREMALPTNVVVDLTTWSTTRERSRLPVNAYTGAVDIMVQPDGTVVPTTLYSTPSSVGLASAFLHFWLAERSDLAPPRASTTAPLLPLPQGLAPTLLGGQELKGEYRLVTVFARTGLITTNENPPFDTPSTGSNGTSYNPNLPFIQAQQGVSGGH